MEKKLNEVEKYNIYINKLHFYPKFLEKKQSEKMISFKELMKGGKFKSCLFTTFGYDGELFNSILEKKIKTLIISDYDNMTPNEILVEKDENTKILYPKKKHYNNICAFHPKLFLLKFDNFLRIVISSANMYIMDWTIWLNIIFKVDLKIIEEKNENKNKNKSLFKEQLKNFIKLFLKDKFNLLNEFLDIELDNYDFDIDLPELVSSFPINKIKLKEINNMSGLSRLKEISKIMKTTNEFTFNNTNIYYSCSSLGMIDFRFLYQFAYSIIPNFEKNFNSEEKNFNDEFKNKIIKLFKVLFPCKSYTNNSKYNEVINFLFLNKYLYNNNKFEKDVLYKYENSDFVPKNEGSLAHTKICIVTQNNEITDDTIIYLGSHNFTKQAWGFYDIKFTEFTSKNYELGIILSPKKNSKIYKEEIIKNLGFKVLDSVNYSKDDLPYLT